MVLGVDFLFFVVYECARCCKSRTQPLASLEKLSCHCRSPKASIVYTVQIRGPGEGKATEGRGQKEGPGDRRGKAGNKRVSAKCKATRASQISIAVEFVHRRS